MRSECRARCSRAKTDHTRRAPTLTRLDDRITPATFAVNNTMDSGPGSLRAAVNDANNNPGPDLIFFYLPGGQQQITLTSGPIIVTDHVDILGPGAQALTIDGNNSSRVLQVGFDLLFGLYGVRIANGKTSGFDYGGAIFSAAKSLTIEDCEFANNSTTSYYSGALDHFLNDLPGFSLTVRRTKFLGNSAMGVDPSGSTIDAGSGGAGYIWTGTTLFEDCSFESNKSLTRGGALVVWGNDVTFRNCTFADNSAITATGSGDGGALVIGRGGQTNVMNCTFSGNAAGWFGGAIHGVLSQPTGFEHLNVSNSTIVHNTAKLGGGGIYDSSLDVDVRSSVVAQNTPNDITSFFGSGISDPTTIANSAIGSPLDLSFQDLGGNLPFGIDLKLAPLADNGGLTKTHAILPGSPLIDQGANPASLASDQRGAGFPRVVGTKADIGAFELQPAANVASVVVNDGQIQRSFVNSITVTFSSVVSFVGDPANAFTLEGILLEYPGVPYFTIPLQVDLSGSTANRTLARLTFFGPLTEFGSLKNGTYRLYIDETRVLDPSGRFLDGNGDGTPGGDFATPPGQIHRLYGDADGNGRVNATDFAAFRLAFGGGPSIFDFNNDGATNALDFAAFRANFGIVLVP